MKKSDEIAMAKRLLELQDRPFEERWPRDLGAALGIPPKRVCALCQKWTDADLYDYGVSVDLGWLTPKGIEAMRSWGIAPEKIEA